MFPKYPHEKSTKLVWRGPQLSELGTASMVTNLKNQQGKQTIFFPNPGDSFTVLISSQPRNSQPNSSHRQLLQSSIKSKEKKKKKKTHSKIGLVGCSSGDRLLISLYTKNLCNPQLAFRRDGRTRRRVVGLDGWWWVNSSQSVVPLSRAAVSGRRRRRCSGGRRSWGRGPCTGTPAGRR